MATETKKETTKEEKRLVTAMNNLWGHGFLTHLFYFCSNDTSVCFVNKGVRFLNPVVVVFFFTIYQGNNLLQKRRRNGNGYSDETLLNQKPPNLKIFQNPYLIVWLPVFLIHANSLAFFCTFMQTLSNCAKLPQLMWIFHYHFFHANPFDWKIFLGFQTFEPP